MDIESEMFFCNIERCKLIIQACLKRQYLSKHPPKRNPRDYSPKTNYSNCEDCDQGKEILEKNKELYLKIEKEYEEKISEYRKPTHRGRKKREYYECKDCGEINPEKFKENRKNKCIICTSKYQKEYRRKK